MSVKFDGHKFLLTDYKKLLEICTELILNNIMVSNYKVRDDAMAGLNSLKNLSEKGEFIYERCNKRRNSPRTARKISE